MKYVFILNPHAGSKNAEAELRNKINASGKREECELYITKGVGDATGYTKQYCEAHPEESVRFIACGGDGTLNEVFNGVIGHENAEVSCYPCGSGNDFVKTFGGAEKFMDLEKLLTAKGKKIDLLKVGDRFSNNVVNFGFDTTVAITVNEGRAKKGNAGKNYYTKGIIRALIKSMRNHFRVYADGELLNPNGMALLCTIANGQYVGGSFRCAPRAKVDDGLMEVCMVKTISRLQVPGLIGKYSKGEHLDDEKMKNIIIYRQAKHVDVTAPEGFAYSLDGEIIYNNIFSVEVVKDAAVFAAPE